MQNLSMYVLDIASNSIRAEATLIQINMIDQNESDLISIEIIDNGKGMDEEMMRKVQDPFFSSRTTRKIGLGIPFFKDLSQRCEGQFEFESEVGVGTRIKASMRKSHWDTPPSGDIGDAVMIAIAANETIHMIFKYTKDHGSFVFDSEEIKEILGDVSITTAEIMLWCKDYINQGIDSCEERVE